MTPPLLQPLSIKIYYVVSGVFFAASAYAQLNDPDPFLWVSGYLMAGCGMQVLGQYEFFQYIARSISTATALFLGFFIRKVIAKLDFSLPPLELGWSFLELEEGREIVGLLLLFLHGLFVRSQYYADSAKAAERSARIGLFVGFFLLGSAVYLWVYYQPAMVAKYQTTHCSGQFHDPLEGGVDGAKEEL